MIDFVLNDQNISADLPFDMMMLDFLRSRHNLTSVKAGCRTGSCGSCLILLGKPDGDGSVFYRPLNSCLLPLEEARGGHVVTVEGLDAREPNPVQRALADKGAVQCGYCSPGMVISLTAFLLNTPLIETSLAEIALDGNLCRCTGYQGTRRAASLLCRKFSRSDVGMTGTERTGRLVEARVLPEYFLRIPKRLGKIAPPPADPPDAISRPPAFIAGGTIFWQNPPDDLSSKLPVFLSRRKDLEGIRMEADRCRVGATTTMEDLRNSPILRGIFPEIGQDLSVIASTPIRHRSTIGGNIANASPVGDISIFFLALDASLCLSRGGKRRTVFLKDFFRAYKKTDRQEDELIEWVDFPAPKPDARFNFERVCMHTDADVPSANSAMLIRTDGERISHVRISAGGVAPIPLSLAKTADFLTGRKIDAHTVRGAERITRTETSPISDIRGSAEYKELLLRQLIRAHFLSLFPEMTDAKELM